MQDCDALSRAPYIDYDRIHRRHIRDEETTNLEVEAVKVRLTKPGTLVEVLDAIRSKVMDKFTPIRPIRCNEVDVNSIITPEKVKLEQMLDPLLHDIICFHNNKLDDMFKNTRHWLNKINGLLIMRQQ